MARFETYGDHCRYGGLLVLLCVFAWPANADTVVQTAALERFISQLNTFTKERRYDDAIAAGNRALELAKSSLGPDARETGSIHYNLASALYSNGDKAAAVQHLRLAASIHEKTDGAGARATADALNNLAYILTEQQEFDEAERLFRHSASAYAALGEPQQRRLATTYRNLGRMYRGWGRDRAAGASYKKALTISRGNVERAYALRSSSVAYDPLQLAQTLEDLGADYLALDETDKAEPVLLQALELRRTALGSDHPAVALAMADLAQARIVKQELADATALLEQARSITVRNLGPDHPKATELSIILSLRSLPPAILVSEAPPVIETDADYRSVRWLARDHAVTVLPSVSSLATLRKQAPASRGRFPFVGIGDPLLTGHPGVTPATIQVASATHRGLVANVEDLRDMWPLPETAQELGRIAETLGADPRRDLILRERATEAVIKEMDLTPYRVVAFATHGLMSGELLKNIEEPGLVLTPPAEGNEMDDGLLTAAEISRLKLDADWVILSACNTAAAAGGEGAEGLSGLARAFFYAGARALLVSHWAVDSKATVALTTGTFDALGRDPSIGRAEALRRSMMALLDDPNQPIYSHPGFWAPFIVVGEGGAKRPGG